MKALDFGDLYKFTASLGLALAVFACILPWLVLREEFDLKLSETQIEELPSTAQEIITTRQKYTETLITVTPGISAVSAIVGILLMGYGLRNWKKRQTLLDEEQSLKNSKLSREVGEDAANLLIGDFLDQFRQLSENQVTLFFMFLRLYDHNHAFQIPKTENDPSRQNEIHDDLRRLREAFLLTAQELNDDKPSGRFKYPRSVVPRPWATKLGLYIAEGQTQGLETANGERWDKIRSRVYDQGIPEIEGKLREAFERSPKDT